MSMTPTHSMIVEADNGDEILFACDEELCGRRVVIKRSGGFVVVDRGDFFARHTGGVGPISMGLDVGQASPSAADN